MTWVEQGNCHNKPELIPLFFSFEYEEIQKAKAYCKECPVAIQCLEYATKTKQKGVWGNSTESQRQKSKRLAAVQEVLLAYQRRNEQREQEHLQRASQISPLRISFQPNHNRLALKPLGSREPSDQSLAS